MALDPAFYPALKADILADPVLSALPNYGEGNQTIAAAYNSPASPSFTVWRSLVTITETGKAFDGAEWAGMTGTNHSRLQTVSQWLPDGYNAGLSDIRAMFDDIWSGAGGANTRTALLALWKRLATRAEKLYAQGTGSNAVPAVLVFEGALSPQDIQYARSS
jgi:hypothetical protein